MRFPACVFGKTDNANLTRTTYRILYRHKDFSEEALRIFNQVRKSFNWRCGGTQQFDPCYAYWPIGPFNGPCTAPTAGNPVESSTGLSFRFLDMGRDNFGRPHTLRMEAVLVAGDSWESTRIYIGSASWPTAPCAADEIDLCPSVDVAPLAEPEWPIYLVNPERVECALFDAKQIA
jgi:hypothetical protein